MSSPPLCPVVTECLLGMPISGAPAPTEKKRPSIKEQHHAKCSYHIIPLSLNNWAVAASAVNFHTHPAAFASTVVNSLWGMQITRFPLSQQYGSSHGGSTMRESGLKHICDSIFCPSAMRNPQRRGHVSRRPAARPRRSPQICTEVFLLDCNFSFFITM